MDGRIIKVLNYIEENFALSHQLADLSAIACLSTSQFHRIFKRETNRTPFKFIEEIKMNKAYQLVVEGKTKIRKLAIALGYNDYETFSRAFKKYFHLSPDDLKAIATKLKEQFESTETGEMIITTLDSIDNQESLVTLLKEIIKEKNISKEDLQNAQIFKITKKSGNTSKPTSLVKNKYEITSGNKIWESLIRQ